MSILFNRCVSLQVVSIFFNIRKINSKFSHRCLFHPSPSCLCFPALPPFFFKDSDFLIKYHFIDGKSLLLFFQCSYPVISHEDAQQFQVHHPSLVFLLRWTQFKLSVLIIFPSLFQVFSYVGSSLNHFPFAIKLFRSAEVIPEDSSSHSQFTQVVLRMLSHSSHLIQLAQSLF